MDDPTKGPEMTMVLEVASRSQEASPDCSPATKPLVPQATNGEQHHDLESATLPPPALDKSKTLHHDAPQDHQTYRQRTARRSFSGQALWERRRNHKWKSPLIMAASFVVGLGLSISHCAFYVALSGTIVGSPHQQEGNLRLGTAFAFLSQITLGVTIWQIYVQWIWRSVKKKDLKLSTLNDIFGADTSVLSFLNFEMFKKFTIGYFIALLGWLVILPPFFTPGTLFVYDSTKESKLEQSVPYLNIANSTQGHLYSYSPSAKGDRYNFNTEVTRVFTGPRTILTRLSSNTAALGQILPIQAPYNQSNTTLTFFGPAVKCSEAEPSVKLEIDRLLQKQMNTLIGPYKEVRSAYYGFVPSFDSQGNTTALAAVRYQAQLNASNEIWMAFERYNYASGDQCDHSTYYQVCGLWNSTIDLSLSFDNGFQDIRGTRELMHKVEYPNDKPGDISNMAQHAYSAFMWALGDQLVGSFGWYEDPRNESAVGFGMINSPIQHTVLLGSSDLAVFFDYNENSGACQIPYANYSAQRQQDINIARNQTLGVLIEELAFNLTVSMMHNPLLMSNVTRLVQRVENVNRYGYNPTTLFIPYALVVLLTSITLIMGVTILYKHDVMPDKKFQDILAAAENNTIHVARTGPRARNSSVRAIADGRSLTFQLSQHSP